MHVCRRIVEITAREILSPLRISTDLDYTSSPDSRRDSAFINHANRPTICASETKERGPSFLGSLNYPLILVAKILLASPPRRKAIFNLHIARGINMSGKGRKQKVGFATVRMIQARFRSRGRVKSQRGVHKIAPSCTSV